MVATDPDLATQGLCCVALAAGIELGALAKEPLCGRPRFVAARGKPGVAPDDLYCAGSTGTFLSGRGLVE